MCPLGVSVYLRVVLAVAIALEEVIVANLRAKIASVVRETITKSAFRMLATIEGFAVMDKSACLKVVWEYMKRNDEMGAPADVIFALGSFDTRVAYRAAELFKQGLAPLLLVSGSGTCNGDRPEWKTFEGRTEAEVFADIARKEGVPDDCILVESKSQNTGQNYEFATALLKERGVDVTREGFRCIAVQKTFMERRTFATGKIWWPAADITVTSPQLSLEEYIASDTTEEGWVHYMVGDLQRIKEYPANGFQIQQDIPEEVWIAYEHLVALGFTNCALK